jgi:enoyl-CoA hydratase/carnithine racemase
VTVNRPKVLNALNATVRQELQAVFEDARSDPAIHGVILTGTGDKAFVGDHDLNTFLVRADLVDTTAGELQPGMTVWLQIPSRAERQ